MEEPCADKNKGVNVDAEGTPRKEVDAGRRRRTVKLEQKSKAFTFCALADGVLLTKSHCYCLDEYLSNKGGEGGKK